MSGVANLPVMQPLFDLVGFEATLINWCNSAALIDAIWEYEMGPQPDRMGAQDMSAYASLSILVSDDLTGAVSSDAYNATGGPGGKPIISRGAYKFQVVRVQVSVMAESNSPYRSAHKFAEQLILALSDDGYRQNLFNPAGIAPITSTTVTRRVPMLEGTRWRSKCVFEFDCTVACNAQQTIQTVVPIGSVQVNGTLLGPPNATVNEKVITGT